MIAHTTFRAIGTTNSILVTRPETLDEAAHLAARHLDQLDRAVSRFRADSEVSRLALAAASREATAVVSPLVVDHVLAGFRAARLSGGLVDCTVGSALVAAGYDRDLGEVQARRDWHVSPAAVPGMHRVRLDADLGILTVPAGTVLDFGATAKAHAADTIAAMLAATLPGGFLVNLGGDIATSGETPESGWSVAVDGPDEVTRQVVTLHDQAMTTSSTQLRTWTTDAGQAHHIIDPRTCRPAEAVWGQVTVVASTALEADIASTSSLILGADAPAWLEERGLPARLDALDGRVVTTAAWPDPVAVAA